MAANLRCILSWRLFALGALYLFGLNADTRADELLASTPPSSRVRPVVRLEATTQNLHLGTLLLYLIDSSKTLTITDIQRPEIASQFRPSTQVIPNFGFAKPAFWFVFSLQNTMPNNDDWLLDIAYQPLDSIEFFAQKNDGTWHRTVLGDMLPYSQRIVDTRTYVLPLHLPDTLVHIYAIRINTESSVQVPLILRHSTKFAEDLARSELAYGIFFGVMLVNENW
jgi:hypothetical protein